MRCCREIATDDEDLSGGGCVLPPKIGVAEAGTLRLRECARSTFQPIASCKTIAGTTGCLHSRRRRRRVERVKRSKRPVTMRISAPMTTGIHAPGMKIARRRGRCPYDVWVLRRNSIIRGLAFAVAQRPLRCAKVGPRHFAVRGSRDCVSRAHATSSDEKMPDLVMSASTGPQRRRGKSFNPATDRMASSRARSGFAVIRLSQELQWSHAKGRCGNRRCNSVRRSCAR